MLPHSVILVAAVCCTVVVHADNMFIDKIFGSPKALQDTYSCCVYRGSSEEDYNCKEEDSECRDQYEDRVTVYLILSLCFILLVVVLCAFRCVRRRRKELLVKRRAKKAPMPMPNRKDFDRLDKEQGDNQDGDGAAAKSGNILAAVFELSAKKKAAAQNNPYVQPQNLTPSEQKKTGNTVSRVDFLDPAEGTNPDEPKDGRIYNRERVLLPNTPSPTPKLEKLNFRNVMQPSRQ